MTSCSTTSRPAWRLRAARSRERWSASSGRPPGRWRRPGSAAPRPGRRSCLDGVGEGPFPGQPRPAGPASTVDACRPVGQTGSPTRSCRADAGTDRSATAVRRAGSPSTSRAKRNSSSSVSSRMSPAASSLRQAGPGRPGVPTRRHQVARPPAQRMPRRPRRMTFAAVRDTLPSSRLCTSCPRRDSGRCQGRSPPRRRPPKSPARRPPRTGRRPRYRGRRDPGHAGRPPRRDSAGPRRRGSQLAGSAGPPRRRATRRVAGGHDRPGHCAGGCPARPCRRRAHRNSHPTPGRR